MFVRVLRDPAGRILLDGERPPSRMETILAPIADGTYSAWDFRRGIGARFVFEPAGAGQSARVSVRGRAAKVEAVLVPAKEGL